MEGQCLSLWTLTVIQGGPMHSPGSAFRESFGRDMLLANSRVPVYCRILASSGIWTGS